MELYIKNMVCNRCIMVVKDILKKNGVQPVSVILGKAELEQALTAQQLRNISADLQAVGFEILDDQKKRVTEKIKNIIIREVENDDRDNNFSEILSLALHKEYSYLSKLFSEAEGITIEKYIIDQKIEKAKELLVYGELSLSEIAFKLGYSSVAHLSSQFKKTTGYSPSEFRRQKDHHRRPLDQV